jgi:hypothetical protein
MVISLAAVAPPTPGSALGTVLTLPTNGPDPPYPSDRDSGTRPFRTTRGSATPVYESIQQIVRDEVTTAQMLRQLEADWGALRRKWGHTDAYVKRLHRELEERVESSGRAPIVTARMASARCLSRSRRLLPAPASTGPASAARMCPCTSPARPGAPVGDRPQQ